MFQPLIPCRAAALLLTLGLLPAGTASDPPAVQVERPGQSVTPAMRGEVIEGVLKRLREGYVFPEVARRMERAIRARVAKKEYDGIGQAEELARVLTRHLQEVSHDTHLRVSYSSAKSPRPTTKEPTPGEGEKSRRHGAAVNFGFNKVERLEGNVGYLELQGFFSAGEAGETASAAMTFLANTDALIIDLRKNGGGNPGMVALMCSYFFGEEPVRLWDQYYRPADETRQAWSLPYVPGKRYLGKPVYLLTSKETYSAGEGFAYVLKYLKRATVVGETTGGGAHSGRFQDVNDYFSVFIPTGRIISPVTKTDWEGTGVKPDVEIAAKRALPTAYLAALKRLAENRQNDPVATGQLNKIIRSVERVLRERK